MKPFLLVSVNFYQHHIGDFNNATRHLTRVERSIYRDLLDLYYDTEAPLTADFDKLARRILVEDGERGALRDVLNEFFVAMENGYHNARADREIASYQRMAEGGKLGAAKRWAKPGDSHPIAPLSPPHAGGNANQEPRTMNHEPRTKDTRAIAPPEGVSPSVWADFQKLRRQKKAPATQTAIDGIKREADKAGVTLEVALAVCCQRGWTGFKSDWMAQPVNRNDVAAVTVPSRQGVDPALAKVIADAQNAAKPSKEILAKLESLKGKP